jgi:sugar phosphate isomerase/epimerase
VLIGAMNHPGRDVLHEIEWIAAMGLRFIDLTLEPPMAASWKVDRPAIRRALKRHGLGVVGHTAFYLPLASWTSCAAVSTPLRRSAPGG